MLAAVLLTAGACLCFGSVAAGDGAGKPVAVVYPDLGEPYRSIFASIVDGVQDQAKGRVVAMPLPAGANPQDVASELRRRDIQAVVALGRNGLRVATSLDRSVGVVVGGVLSVPESEAREFTVHSLAPDPALLLARLKSLVPGAKRVMVVYDPHQNDWLIRLARAAARAQGLELQSFEAGDLKTAVRLYREALSAADPKTDVLWLPQDSTTVDESVVVPMVLELAWGRGMAVFSSSVNHVKRGALFSLYPDNLELGRALAAEALGRSGARGVTPLTEVLLAVNTRTASHLGINIDRRQERVAVVFPEP